MAEDEKRKVVVELNDRAHQVEKLKAKFDVLSKGGVSKIGEDGKEQSQAYFIIKAAQKREELQREGDNLDQEIQKSEREIRAMQNTLNHLVNRNGNLRVSLQKAPMSGQDAEELRRLEEQAKLAQNELFHKKKELQRLNTDCEEDMQRLDQVRSQCKAFQERNEHYISAKAQVEGELIIQKESIAKVEARLVKNLEAFRAREDLSKGDKAHIEKVLKTKVRHARVREEHTIELLICSTLTYRSFAAFPLCVLALQVLREATTNLLFTLGQLANEFPESSSTILKGVDKAHLEIPSRPVVRSLNSASDQARAELISDS